jgi:hypothetical protein
VVCFLIPAGIRISGFFNEKTVLQENKFTLGKKSSNSLLWKKSNDTNVHLIGSFANEWFMILYSQFINYQKAIQVYG